MRLEGRSHGATGPSRQTYFDPPTCIALLRWAAQAPILPLSIASCACAISFCATILPSPSAMASIMDSVLLKLSPLQPPIFAADAGTIANATAAIAAAPSNLLIMFVSNPHLEQSGVIAEICENDCWPIDAKLRNEFRAMQM